MTRIDGSPILSAAHSLTSFDRRRAAAPLKLVDRLENFATDFILRKYQNLYLRSNISVASLLLDKAVIYSLKRHWHPNHPCDLELTNGV